MPRRRLILFVMLLALVAACSTLSGPAASPDGRSIVIGAGLEPDNLNPILGFAPDGVSKIFDGLVSRDASLALVPALAEQLPAASPDGLAWTAALRPGVTFSDGTPLSAQDVVFTYQSVLDPKVDTTIASNYDALEQVSTPDERTVVFRLKYPTHRLRSGCCWASCRARPSTGRTSTPHRSTPPRWVPVPTRSLSGARATGWCSRPMRSIGAGRRR
jgi:ABC-type transport system substrate-binding protein